MCAHDACATSLMRVQPCSLLDAFDARAHVPAEFGGPAWGSKLRLIHLAFNAAGDGDNHNRIYALASDLLDDEAVNAVIVLRMTDDWQTCTGRRIIPLPTQDCACHRIAFVDCDIAGRPQRSRSIVITELASSKLLQIKVRRAARLCACGARAALWLIHVQRSGSACRASRACPCMAVLRGRGRGHGSGSGSGCSSHANVCPIPMPAPSSNP